VATLRCFYAIYTDGARPNEAFDAPAGTDVFLGEMGEVTFPSPQDELFGPHASVFQRYKPKKGFLLAVSREVRGRAGTFFDDARAMLLKSVEGVAGWGFDVLRLWPFPLATAAADLPEDLLAEDLFAVGFEELGEHGYRAETYGLAKLGQREISFAFRGRELIEEAAMLCGHLADWVLEHGRIVEHKQAMSFGFDRISFFAVEGQAGGPFRGWHPPVIQRLLPASLFPGVGVLEVLASNEESGTGEKADLTGALQRSLDQRVTLEELDLTGDSPNHTQTAWVKGAVHALANLVATREEPRDSKDSGWRLTSRVVGEGAEAGAMPLGDIARRAPAIIRYLAMPPGVRLEWDEQGSLTVDASRALQDEGEDDELDDDEDL